MYKQYAIEKYVIIYNILANKKTKTSFSSNSVTPSGGKYLKIAVGYG